MDNPFPPLIGPTSNPISLYVWLNMIRYISGPLDLRTGIQSDKGFLSTIQAEVLKFSVQIPIGSWFNPPDFQLWNYLSSRQLLLELIVMFMFLLLLTPIFVLSSPELEIGRIVTVLTLQSNPSPAFPTGTSNRKRSYRTGSQVISDLIR